MKTPIRLVLGALAMIACSGGAGDPDAITRDITPYEGNGDVDSDGVADAEDNCPISANSNQGNEDGDRFGDVCDACPHLGDDNPLDGDMDGVGDACDPNPIFFGDAVILFEGFHTGVPSGWDESGTWTLTSGAAQVSAIAQPATLAVSLTDRTRETVMASITVDSLSGGASGAGVIDNKQAGTLSGVACELTSSGATKQLSLDDPSAGGGATTTGYQMTPGTTYTVTLRRNMTSYTCTGVAGAATATVTGTMSLANSPYLSGLYVHGATVRVSWLLVIESL